MYKKNTKLGSLGVQRILFIHIAKGHIGLYVMSTTWGVKISPRMSQKRLRFGDDVGKREFIKFTKKYHQRLEEECASVGRVTVCAMSPPRLADIGVLLQEVEEATHD